jgi:hypothetical protein
MADNNNVQGLAAYAQQLTGSNPSAQQPAAGQDNVQALTNFAHQVNGTSHINMITPEGNQVVVPQNKVDDMRKQNYAVSPDNPGVQRMATSQGQLTYALPDEVEKFKSSGHVPIQDNGYFEVTPLPGEESTDTMARAAAIAKNLPPDVMQKAIDAEKKTFTAKNLFKATVVAPVVVGGGTMLALTGAGAAIDAAPAATAATLRFIGTRGAQAVLPGLEEEAGKAIVKQVAKSAAKKYIVGEAASRVFTHKSLLSNILEFF